MSKVEMSRLFSANRKTILFAACLVLSVLVVAFTLNIKTNSQQLQVSSQKDNDVFLKQIENSPEQSLKVAENNDSPLKIVQATVKEVSGSDFTKLTGKTTNLLAVSSVPEVKLMNTSGKTITGFVFAIRDPIAKELQTLVQHQISIAPGETYVVKREQFVPLEKTTVSDNSGTHQKRVLPKMNSAKYWIDFSGRSDFFVTVGIVYFQDGSKWAIREEGEIK